MRIIAYSSSDDANVVEKRMTYKATFDGTLRNPCSMLAPVINIEYNGIPNDWTHLYIVDFNRWYFVNDIVSVNNNLIQVSASVDVLQSFKGSRDDETGIYGLTGYVTRNQFNRDYRLSDNTYPSYLSTVINHYSTTPTTAWVGSSHYLQETTLVTRYVIIMQGIPKYTGQQVTNDFPLVTLVTDKNGFNYFVNKVGNTTVSISGKTLSDYIYFMGALPCHIPINKPVDEIDLPGIISGSIALQGTFGIPSKNDVVRTVTFSITVTKSNNTKYYLNRTPFTSYSMTFQPFGKIELDSKYFVPTTTANTFNVYFKVKVDILTGNALLYYGGDNSTPVYIASANVLYRMPLSSTAFNGASIASSALSIVGSTASMIATEGATTPAFVSSLVGGANSLATPNTTITGGDTKMIDDVPTIETCYNQPTQESRDLFGQVVCAPIAIKTLYGYTEIARIHLDTITATDKEKKELESILKSGVIFENE